MYDTQNLLVLESHIEFLSSSVSFDVIQEICSKPGLARNTRKYNFRRAELSFKLFLHSEGDGGKCLRPKADV